MFCTKCGNELEEGILFCSKCGNMISISEPESESDSTVDTPSDSNENVNADSQAAPVMQAPQPPQYGQDAPYSQPQGTDMNGAPYGQPQGTDMNGAPYGQSQGTDMGGVQQPSPYAYNQMMQAPQPPQYGQDTPYGQPSQYSQPPVSIPVKPKKSKAPLIIGIAAVAIAIVAALVLLLKPAVDMLISPEKSVKTALKQSTGQLMSVVNESFSGNDLSTSIISSGKQEFTYQFKIDRATVNGSSFLTQLKADTINMNIQVSPSDRVVAGTMGLALNGSSKSEIETNFYMDSRNIYMNVPALCSRSFYMETEDVFDELGIDYDMLFSMMGNSSIESMIGSSNMSMYSGVLQAMVKDVFAAVDTLIEEASYKKAGKVVLTGDQGNVNATQFIITINEGNIKNFAVNVLDNIFNDDTLKPLLGLTMTGNFNKDALRRNIEKTDLKIGDISMKAAVNSKKQLVAVTFDTDLMSWYKDDRVAVEVKFVGKDNIYDCVGISAIVDEMEARIMVSEKNDNVRFTMELIPDRMDPSDEFFELVMDMTVNSSDPTSGTAVINEYSLRGKIDNDSIDVAISGSFGFKGISSISKKKSDFSRPINPDRATNSEMIEVASEVMKNVSVLKSVLSDDAYNKLYRTLMAG